MLHISTHLHFTNPRAGLALLRPARSVFQVEGGSNLPPALAECADAAEQLSFLAREVHTAKEQFNQPDRYQKLKPLSNAEAMRLGILPKMNALETVIQRQKANVQAASQQEIAKILQSLQAVKQMAHLPQVGACEATNVAEN